MPQDALIAGRAPLKANVNSPKWRSSSLSARLEEQHWSAALPANIDLRFRPFSRFISNLPFCDELPRASR
jgi:hypothetical protein